MRKKVVLCLAAIVGFTGFGYGVAALQTHFSNQPAEIVKISPVSNTPTNQPIKTTTQPPSKPVTKSASTTASSTTSQKSCSTTVLPHGTTYQDASWLQAGRTEASAQTGINGLKTICNGVTSGYVQPYDAVIYRGTQISVPTLTPPTLKQYFPTTPPLSHAGCVQSVHAQAPTADADAFCTGIGY